MGMLSKLKRLSGPVAVPFVSFPEVSITVAPSNGVPVCESGTMPLTVWPVPAKPISTLQFQASTIFFNVDGLNFGPSFGECAAGAEVAAGGPVVADYFFICIFKRVLNK